MTSPENQEAHVCVRSILPECPSGHVIARPASMRCTRELPGSKLSHLTEVPSGALRVHDLDEPKDYWPHPIITLGDCAIGDRVYLDDGVDVGGPHLWMLFEVVAS